METVEGEKLLIWCKSPLQANWHGFGKMPFEKLQEPGYDLPREFALFPPIYSENRFPMCHCDPERSEGEAISLSLPRACFGALPLATTTYFHDSLVGNRP